MRFTEIPIGDPILLDIENVENFMTVSAKAIEWTEKGLIVATRSKIRALSDDDIVSMRYITQKGQLFRWIIEKREVLLKNRQNCFLVYSNEDAVNANQRGAFRMYVGKYGKLKIRSQKELLNVILKDVSLTGVGFLSTVELNENERPTLTFEDAGLTIEVQIAFIRSADEPRINGYFYGTVITDTDESLQKYITAKQLEEVKKIRKVLD